MAFSQGDFATAGDSPGPPLPSLESQLFDRSQVPETYPKKRNHLEKDGQGTVMAMAISYKWLFQ